MSQAIVEKLAIEQLADFIRRSGYRAVVKTGRHGPEIDFSSNGYKCSVFHSPSELKSTGGFTEFNIYAIVKAAGVIDAHDLNEFNQKLKFGHCYTSDKGHVFYDQRISITGGVTEAHILHVLARWDKDLGECLRFISFAEQKALELKNKISEMYGNGPQEKDENPNKG